MPLKCQITATCTKESMCINRDTYANTHATYELAIINDVSRSAVQITTMTMTTQHDCIGYIWPNQPKTSSSKCRSYNRIPRLKAGSRKRIWGIPLKTKLSLRAAPQQ